MNLICNLSMSTVNVHASRVKSGVDHWNGILTDAIVKCGRKSDRRLYLYGISSSRCPKCQLRIVDKNVCSACHYELKTLRQCLRCSKKNEPVMWCVECDAYLCAHCHKKPHVLMLESSKPHHCFAIDSASGKYLVEAAWSDKISSIVKAEYRLRLHDKMKTDKAKSKSNAASESADVEGRNLPKDSVSASKLIAEDKALKASFSSVTAASLIERVKEQSRKRQHSRQDIEKGKKLGRASKASHSAELPADGMSLYDRVKAMHDMRAKAVQLIAFQASSLSANMNKSIPRQNDDRIEHKEDRAIKKDDHSLLLQRKQDYQLEQAQKEQSKKDQENHEQEKSEQLKNEPRVLHKKELCQTDEQRLQDSKRRQKNQLRQKELLQQQQMLRQVEQHRQKNLQEQLRRQVKRRREEKQQLEEKRLREQTLQQQSHHHVLDERVRPNLREHELLRQAQAKQSLRTQADLACASHPENPAPMLQEPNSRFSPISASKNVSACLQPSSLSDTPCFPIHSNHGPVQSTSNGNERQCQLDQGQPGVSLALVCGTSSTIRFETIQQDHGKNHNLVVRNISNNQQQQVHRPPKFSAAIVPHRMTPDMGEERFHSNKPGGDDELRAIWVNDYDNSNALVMQLDMEIAKRMEEGHEFVHKMNNLTISEQLKLLINNLHAKRDAAVKRRFESVIRVLIFSETVRLFAQQNAHAQIWSDVPAVITSSHKKCADLAAIIREYESKAQILRGEIDDAVSSGNPLRMQHVARQGAMIADLEHKACALNGERDKQFIFMFQFSEALRQIVHNEWSAPEKNH
ncbi:uncharacterized protein CCR75_005467 [Bremia lactucae]|uniref:B box-type domain-containing protein n=1 Tax=Bremia lactucae TaxID=4779 RepID=A0A976NZ23_BRELC|nr:hypothetical protein CCR75_005467 [Bremia lactucae]